MANVRLEFENKYSARINTEEEMIELRKPGALVEYTFDEMDQIVAAYKLVSENRLKFEAGRTK